VSLGRGWTTAVCIASGPSLDAEQTDFVSSLRDWGCCNVIAVNDAWTLVPNADVLYAGDLSWWTSPRNQATPVRGQNPRAGLGMRNVDVARRFLSNENGGELWTVVAEDRRRFDTERGARELALQWIRGVPGKYAPPAEDALGLGGGNGGNHALQLAALFGARRIVLIGYDMQRTGGRAHFFGQHPKPLSQGAPGQWVKHFATLKDWLTGRGVEVVNCSKATAIDCFPRADLRQVFAG
jgi:hypothetical protein